MRGEGGAESLFLSLGDAQFRRKYFVAMMSLITRVGRVPSEPELGPRRAAGGFS